MPTVSFKLGDIGPQWKAACKQAVTDLNHIFRRKGINVTLAINGHGFQVPVTASGKIGATLVQGLTHVVADFNTGMPLEASVDLPVKLTIPTPQGTRVAGAGVHVALVAHEFLHALGHSAHNSHLMGDRMDRFPGDRPAGDKLRFGSVSLPPLQISDESVEILKGIWP